MKVGVRTPSIKRRISARTSVKRRVRAKVRAPRGYGFITNPKKAAYNRVYNRTSISADRLIKNNLRSPRAEPNKSNLTYENEDSGRIIRSSSRSLSVSSKGFGDLKLQINEVYAQNVAIRRQLSKAKLVYVLTLFRPRKKREIEDIKDELEKQYVELKFADNSQLEKSWMNCIDSFNDLSASQKVWDLTYSRKNNKVVERTMADSSLKRSEVKLIKKSLDFIHSDLENIFLPNANGPDLYIFPTFLIMFKNYREFSIHDSSELNWGLRITGFLEESAVPKDSEVAGYTWKKTNKDGSRDKRFNGNYQIPILKYGELTIQSDTGIDEDYMFSDSSSFTKFAKHFIAHIERLLAANKKSQNT